MDKTSTAPTTAGIDVAKAKLDIALPETGEHWQVENATGGFRQLAGRLEKAGVERVGIEATGGYERGVVRYLRKCGITVIVLQPAQVRHFGHSRLGYAKNDRLDAMLIARCAALAEPGSVESDERMIDLAGQLTFIEQIEADIVRWKTRKEKAGKAQKPCIEREIKRFEELRKTELARLEMQLRKHADLANRLDLVRSIRGIALRTALALVIRMPELGCISREAAAKFAGLAPFDDDSGRRQGKRTIRAGRRRVRRSLYAAAQAAVNFGHNRQLAAFHRRLVDSGKPQKLVFIACARKLLIYANTVLQRGTPWQMEPAAA